MTVEIAAELFPSSATSGPHGITVGGVALAELASRYGTPLVVYDEAHLRQRCCDARSAFPDGVSYAAKAFLCKAIARLVHEEGLGLDVASGGELAVAVAAGLPGSAITMHGNNKSDREITLALRHRVGRIVIDSHEELTRVEADAAVLGLRVPVAIRVNPGVQAATHPSIRTGGVESKFGVSIVSGAAQSLARLAQVSRSVDLHGVHVHIGSQLTGMGPSDDAIASAAAFALMHGAEELIVGGGLGVPYRVGDHAPTFRDWSSAAGAAAERGGFTGRILAEPGRSIVAAAGIAVYSIGTVKEAGVGTRFVAVDGGISDNPRPALYGARYHAELVAPVDDSAPMDEMRYTVVGKNCESSDVFAEDVVFHRSPRAGDLLAIPVAGAYGYAMASNYNGLGRPAVVFVADGQERLVLRREDESDMSRLDVA
jgi:diaminopimelate decarboxylase